MTSTLKIDGVNHRVVIYDGAENLDLEADPLNNLSSISFHSDLEYVGFKKVTKTYTIPACGAQRFVSERVNLGSHGRGFSPVLFAILRGWINGSGSPVDLPIGGGLLLDFFGNRPPNGGTFSYFAGPDPAKDRWTNEMPTWAQPPPGIGTRTRYNNGWQQRAWFLGAGADDQDLFLWWDQSTRDSAAAYPATTVTIDFYVGNRSIDGTGQPVPSSLFSDEDGVTEITANGLSVGGASQALFSSEDVHVYQPTGTPDFSTPLSTCFSFLRSVTPNGGYADSYALRFASNWAFHIRSDAQWGTQVPGLVGMPSGGFVGVDF